MDTKKEIMPVYKQVLIDVYDQNPYKNAVTDAGLEVSDEFINSDSGQVDKRDLVIECARILEAGPDCEFVQPGDDILIDIRTISPIPFFGNMYWLVDEHAIKAVINENLKERFKKN